MALRWRWAALLLFGLVLGLLLGRHAFWRDEVHTYQIAVHTDSISSLFYHLRYQGHPALWFLVLRGLRGFSNASDVLRGAHWLLASLNAFLILWYCPIPPWQRIACCFGYFMMFEFGVISRGYALELLFAFVFVAIQTRYPLATAVPALLLALLVHTSVPGALLAVALLAYWATRLWGDGHASRLRLLGAIVIVGASLAGMVWYVNPPADSSFANDYRAYREQLTATEVMGNARLFLRAAVPVPRLDTLHFWNTNWTDSIPPRTLRFAFQILASALCFALAALSFIHRSAVIALFAAGTVLLAGFSIAQGQTFMRHQGQWFVLLLICCWIDRVYGDAGGRDFGGWQRKIRRWFPAVIFAIQPIALIVVVVRSFVTPFSATPALVTQVMERRLDSAGWVVWPEEFVSPVSFASGRPVYSPQHDLFERFSVWKGPTTAAMKGGLPEISHRLAAQLANAQSPLILCTNEESASAILPGLPQDIAVRELVRIPEGIVQDEANVAFLLNKIR